MSKRRAMFQCGNCLKKSENMQRCSKCENVRYCNSVCQEAHWKTHKLVCKDIKLSTVESDYRVWREIASLPFFMNCIIEERSTSDNIVVLLLLEYAPENKPERRFQIKSCNPMTPEEFYSSPGVSSVLGEGIRSHVLSMRGVAAAIGSDYQGIFVLTCTEFEVTHVLPVTSSDKSEFVLVFSSKNMIDLINAGTTRASIADAVAALDALANAGGTATAGVATGAGTATATVGTATAGTTTAGTTTAGTTTTGTATAGTATAVEGTAMYRCGFCDKSSATNKCGNCKNIHYCSRSCQKSHWKTHKAVCRASRSI
jgi:MYND finger